MRRTFQNDGKGSTEVKMFEHVDNTGYVGHLVVKMIENMMKMIKIKMIMNMKMIALILNKLSQKSNIKMQICDPN